MWIRCDPRSYLKKKKKLKKKILKKNIHRFNFYSKNGKTNVGWPAIQIKKLLSPNHDIDDVMMSQ
jgi:hypothetical protein